MRNIRHKLWIGLIILLAVCGLCACKDREETRLKEAVVTTEEEAKRPQDSLDNQEKKDETETEEEPSVICVYVCGKVKNPGVYELRNGDRVVKAIEAAGGMTEDASEEVLNQAQMLQDGQQIYVPDKEEAAQPGLQMQTGGEGNNPGVQGGADTKVNLNTASKEELMTLTGIGESRAESILLYRQEHGSFKNIEEIKQIAGIKDAIFGRIKDRITI